ncbi:MAG: nucleotidyltransferase [Bacilli bacterium]|nr:nucleotidyltransferase [Bacilli bacterium]
MKKIGLIAEFNPFHNGHKYLIDKIKKKYPDSILILVLSGNFTQRGNVSLIDKWKKTDISLQSGIDLVVELPIRFATDSADYFAFGAITLLEKLQVDTLIFGSESNDVTPLEKIVDCELNNPEFDNLVKLYSKTGLNYPTALSSALLDLTGEKITTPNDLLGISYIKAIKKNNYHMTYETIKRTNDYHSKELDNDIVSATAIKEAIKNKEDITNYVPKYVLPYLEDFHFFDDYFNLLKYKIITDNNLDKYQTVDKDITVSLKDKIIDCTNIDEYIKSLKSKHYTYNQIERMLIHILIGLTKEDASNWNKISYIRLLGFNEEGREYLNKIKKELDVSLISKISREKDPRLEFEINSTKIYALNLDNDKQKELLQKEYQNKLYRGDNNE